LISPLTHMDDLSKGNITWKGESYANGSGGSASLIAKRRLG
jgi:hypothetical protein